MLPQAVLPPLQLLATPIARTAEPRCQRVLVLQSFCSVSLCKARRNTRNRPARVFGYLHCSCLAPTRHSGYDLSVGGAHALHSRLIAD